LRKSQARAGLQNGELLQAAEDKGMEVLGRRLAIVALSAIQLPIIIRYLPKIIVAIDSATPGSFQAVDCGTSAGKNWSIANLTLADV
jgi:hypothetical protein